MMGSTNPEVVLYSFFPWRHQYPSTAHGLARALAKHTRVWFVSKPPTYKDALTGKRAPDSWRGARVHDATGFGGSLKLVDLPPTPPLNVLPEGRIYAELTRLLDRRMSAALGKVLTEAGVRDYVWINLFAPTQFTDLELPIAPLLRYYYCVDAIDQTAYTARHGRPAEWRQLERSDAGLNTSSRLATVLAASGKPMYVLPNGMDGDHYLDRPVAPEPAELRGVPHPRIGYVGNFDGHRLDFELLIQLARKRPDLHQVLIGPWNAAAELKAELEAFPNVHLLGRKRQEACPDYLQHVDLGLIPFRINELTAAIYPLKINEYLALGLPVLSTPFSVEITSFTDVVTLAEADRWVEVIDRAMAASGDDERRHRIDRARESTWEARAADFLAHTTSLLAGVPATV